MVTPPVPDNEARQAIDALAGYSYQLYQTLLAWLALGPDEFLFIEIAEDYAVATSTQLTATQVKATAANITLHTEAVVDAINAYWSTRGKNSNQHVSYHYLTTSNIGKEKGLKFPEGMAGLEYWRIAARPGSDVKPIRDALLSLDLDKDLADFVKAASDDDLRDQLLAPMHWDCGEESLPHLKEAVELKTVGRAQASSQATVSEGKKLVLPLVGFLLSVSTSKASRRLTSVELDEFIQERLTTQVPTRFLTDLLAKANLPDAPGYTEAPVLIDAAEIPFPEPLLERLEVIDTLAPIATRSGVLLIQGGSGKGKSVLARLLAKRLRHSWSVLDFRGLDVGQTNGRLGFAASRLPKGSLVLDDFPIELDANVEKLLAVLVRMVRLQDGVVLITSNSTPSARMLSLLNAPSDAVVDAPNLTPLEVAAAVQQLGGDGKLWGPVVHAVCGLGHPQLVMARLRRLTSESWPSSQVLGGIDPAKPAEEIEDEKAVTRRRLIDELDDRTRSLVDRLSVIGIRFDRPLALAVAAIDPPIPNAGDSLTMLIGPWVEKLDRNFMRLSPLLMGSSHGNLLPDSIKEIHQGAVIAIMKRQPIDGSMIGQAFIHALAGDVDAILVRIVMLPIMVEEKHRAFVAEELAVLEAFRTDQLLRPKNPYVSIFMRLGQFKVCVERGSVELAEKVALRLIKEVLMLPEDQLGEGLAAFVICLVLSEQKLARVIPGWCGFVLKYLHLRDTSKGELADLIREREKALAKQMGLDVPQFLFISMGTRRSSLKALEETFTELDNAAPEDRSYLLSSFDTQFGDRNFMISNAWMGDAEKAEFDATDASTRFRSLAKIAEKWGDTKLALECIVASSVMMDEYGKNPPDALEILDAADAHYGMQTLLRQQRVKVLQRKGDHPEALSIIHEIGDLIDPTNYVGRAFFYRSAGVSASELGRWDEAIDFFGSAREAALQASDEGGLAAMAIGLLGDQAGCAVKAGRVEKGIAYVKQAILELESREPPITPIQLQTRHLIGHVPAWMDTHLFGNPQTPAKFSLPSGRCSQPELFPGLQDRPIYPLDLLWYQLAQIELRAGLNVGIRSSVRAWPDSRKILSMEFVLAKEDLDYVVHRRDLGQFQEVVAAEISAFAGMAAVSNELKAESPENMTRGVFPALANLDHPYSHTLISEAILAFGLSAFLAGDNEAFDRLLELKEGDVGTHPACQAILAALREGHQSNEPSLAGYLHQLKFDEDLSPNDIFRIQCLIVPALAQTSTGSHSLIAMFAAWVKKAWTRIIYEERFRLRSPYSTVPIIETALAKVPDNRLAYAAAVLLAADDAVSNRLSADFHKLIRNIASGEK